MTVNKSFSFYNSKCFDLQIIEPFSSTDERGIIKKTFEKRIFYENNISFEPIEEMETTSKKGVIRGLHFQLKKSQAKIIRCVRGEIFDVAVDLRLNSSTFGKVYLTTLSEHSNKMIYIPRGFAHGCLSMAENTTFYYLSDSPYYPEFASGIIWNDVQLNIPWPAINDCNFILSLKDNNLPTFNEFKEKYHGFVDGSV